MRKTIHAGIGVIFLSVLLCSCTAYGIYSRDLTAGKNLFETGRYDEAQKYFQDAARRNIDGAAFTYLAAVAYKQNDLDRAGDLIANAEQSPPDMLSSLRMYGYKALILLSSDSPRGMTALKEYIDRYNGLFPLESIKDIRDMWQSGNVDKNRLEAIMDEQIKWYEQDMELYIYNKVGFYARDGREGEN